MSRDELLNLLRDIRLQQYRLDCEEDIDHGRADQALLDFIDDDEIRSAFDAIRKWYS